MRRGSERSQQQLDDMASGSDFASSIIIRNLEISNSIERLGHSQIDLIQRLQSEGDTQSHSHQPDHEESAHDTDLQAVHQ